jgi:cellulose synthase/poly-beta-1,6-N-acetylglucosamine synthase-like glycosyltransferase
MRDVLAAFGLFILGYFALLNAIYLAFTLYAFKALTRRLRQQEYSPEAETFASPFSPAVSVILPAYNEEAVIVASVRSLLRLRYPFLEIVVVADGSTDATVKRMREAFDLVEVRRALRDSIATQPVLATYVSRRHPEIVVIEKENGGKADSVNAGINAAGHEFLCVTDADAVLEPDALLHVTRPIIDDPDLVVATGGIVRIINGCRVEDGEVVEVGLPRSRLAVFQVIEYFRAFLVGRVNWSRSRSLLIISGAFGMFRRDVVEAVGGWWNDTVGEDAELVVRIHRYLRGRDEDYLVEFVPDPVCWTEAPESFRSLGSQRRRWQRGLGETIWRHKRMIGRPRYGTVGLLALPYFLVFELLGPIIELIGYLLIPVAVLAGALNPAYLLVFFLLALVLGVFLSVASLALEEFSFRRHRRSREIARMMLYTVLESFGYRQLTSYWRVREMIAIAMGRKATWQALPRRGLGADAAAEASE